MKDEVFFFLIAWQSRVAVHAVHRAYLLPKLMDLPDFAQIIAR